MFILEFLTSSVPVLWLIVVVILLLVCLVGLAQRCASVEARLEQHDIAITDLMASRHRLNRERGLERKASV